LDAIFGVLAAPKAPLGPDGDPVLGMALNITNVRVALADERGRDLLAQLAEHAAGLQVPPPEYGLKELPEAVAERLEGDPPHGPDGPA
jgi:hypothetical protein